MSNPVLVNDLRKSLFRRKPVLAFAYAAVAILVITMCIAAGVPIDMMFRIREVPLWHFPDLLLPVIVPAFAAGSFAKEHEQRTWQDILLTNLGSWEILRGKFLAALLPTIVSVIILFPPFALLLILQGVSWAFDPGFWMVVELIKFLISAFFYISLVMLCSYYAHSGRTALVISYIMLAMYAALNYLLYLGLQQATMSSVYDTDSGMIVHSSMFDSQPSGGFSLSFLEVLHMAQSLLFGVIILIFMKNRFGKRG